MTTPTSDQRKLHNQRYYQKNKEAFAKRRDAQREINRRYVQEAKSNPCTRCENTFPPCAMDFHHRDPNTKDDVIARMVVNGFSTKRIREEIDKCDLLCATCHRIVECDNRDRGHCLH